MSLELHKNYLLKDGKCLMNSQIKSVGSLYKDIIEQSKGKTICYGLGMAFLDEHIDDITYVEIDADIIDLIKTDSKVIEGDAFKDHKLAEDYETVILDIWSEFNQKELQEGRDLKRIYQNLYPNKLILTLNII